MKKFFLILLISVALSGPKMKSLLVPGWGEFSLDKQSRGKFFLCAESVLIISAFSFNNLSNSYKTDYTAYAAQHANVDLSNEDFILATTTSMRDSGLLDIIIPLFEEKEQISMYLKILGQVYIKMQV